MDDGQLTLGGQARFAHYVVPEIEVMVRVARSITGSAVEAEDLVQDALVRAFRSIDKFDGQHPRAWLLTIVRNTHINRNRRQRPVLLDDPDAWETSGRDSVSNSVEDDYLDRTFDTAIAVSLRNLSDDARRVIELVDIAGQSYAEAADELQVPVGTVMSRLHRARRKVREDLRPSGLAPRRFR
ncbi:MAG: RNA polymerase sigma factor [Acidimicrobiales bacterium]